MNAKEIMDRTSEFAIRILKLASAMPKEYASQVIARQIIRSATSVGANYRSACRSKSRNDFINKLKIVEEELDETGYWLSLIGDAGIFPHEKLAPLATESDELLSIMVKSIVTARKNLREKKGI
jgi:four helix bundle protein